VANGFEHPLVKCSLWLHIGFIGASAVAIGVLQLFDGAWHSALALVFFGGLLAVTGWRRGRIVLQPLEPVSRIGKPSRQRGGPHAGPAPWTVNG
jgi:hypothetical protein